MVRRSLALFVFFLATYAAFADEAKPEEEVALSNFLLYLSPPPRRSHWLSPVPRDSVVDPPPPPVVLRLKSSVFPSVCSSASPLARLPSANPPVPLAATTSVEVASNRYCPPCSSSHPPPVQIIVLQQQQQQQQCCNSCMSSCSAPSCGQSCSNSCGSQCGGSSVSPVLSRV